MNRIWKALRSAGKNSLIYQGYFERPLDADRYFLESRNGKEIAGNILRIMLYLKERKDHAREEQMDPAVSERRESDLGISMVTAAEKEKIPEVKRFLAEYGLQEVKVVPYGSVRYYRELSRSKYLVNDVTFPNAFIKKEGQVYLNTWHGTPYKCMGKDNVADCGKMDNMQRNLYMADILLYPSEYCRDRMMNAYSLNGLYEGNVLFAGYPRNSIFFDSRSREKTRQKYHLEEKRVYVYLPTYREAANEEEAETQAAELQESLNRLEERLEDSEVLYVKLHNLVQQRMRALSFEEYTHIREFPSGIETYEFLNAADCLITDYSSVFFDFALTGRKIVRFVYDEERYFRNRGFYEVPTEIPFPRVWTVEGLLSELRCAKGYEDTEFLETYGRYENRNATDIVMRALRTAGKRSTVADAKASEGDSEAETGAKDEKKDSGKNVFLYGGGLKTNGITTSLLHLVKYLNLTEVQGVLGFGRTAIGEHTEILQSLPKDQRVLEINDHIFYRLSELLAVALYQKGNLSTRWIQKKMDQLYERENRRIFTGMPFDTYIHFTGYGAGMTRLLQRARGNRILYVHNDMWQEVNTKQNNHARTLQDAYRSYDHVAVVAEQLRPVTEKLSGEPNDRVSLVHNLQDADGTRKRAEEPIRFGERTTIFPEMTEEQLGEILAGENQCFASIGRFSPEKDHTLLLQGFARYVEQHPETILIIIGEEGPEYETIREMTSAENLTGKVILMQNVPNPMPILKKCQLFLLTSRYEGMPMVFFEAEALGIPAAAVRTPGCREFMEEFEGYLMEPTPEGVAAGMEDYQQGLVRPLGINFDEFNARGWKELWKLL